MSIGNFIKSLQDIMRKDAGINGDAQRIEQIVWLLFLRIFETKEEEWELEEDNYKEIIPSKYRWNNWATDEEGITEQIVWLLFLRIFETKEEEWELEEDNYKEIIPSKYRWNNWATDEEGITGDELLEFVDTLFKDLKNMEVDEYSDSRKILVKEFFKDTHNYMKSGTLLRQVINVVNEIEFDDYEDRHAFNDVYETILRDLQSAGNAGEFYTPRGVTNFVIDRLQPKLGEKIGDFACGTGGFLISALEYIRKNQEKEFTVEDLKKLGESIYGIEKKPLPYSLCITNMMLHNIDTPNIRHDKMDL